jgi:hypothetical protein
VKEPDPTHLWTRVVADTAFRDALVEDPLRALAEARDVRASAEQVRRLEEMDRDERAELIAGIVREVHWRGGQARFGRVRDDGRIGGPDE